MRRLWLAVLVGLAVACGANTADDSTTIASPTTTTTVATTTPVVETTATTEVKAVDICRGSYEVWHPGLTYTADCFLQPVSFLVDEEGWASSSAGDTWLLVRWRDPADSDFVIWVGMLTMANLKPATEEVDEILAIDGISAVTSAVPFSISGAEGVTLTVEGAPESRSGGAPACTGRTAVSFLQDEAGYMIGRTGYPKGAIGVGACHVAQLWVVEVGESTVTIVGGSEDPDRHEAAAAKIEELFEGMSFEVP